jgi:hypothetical protein
MGSHAYSVLLLLLGMQSGCAVSSSSQREAREFPSRTEEARPEEGAPVIVKVGDEGLFSPRFECMEFGCPATVKCGKAVCSVIHCGKRQCQYCPEPLPDFLKNIAFKAWCSYGCMAGTLRTGSAFGLVTSFGEAFAGPICLDESSSMSRTEMRAEEQGP